MAVLRCVAGARTVVATHPAHFLLYMSGSEHGCSDFLLGWKLTSSRGSTARRAMTGHCWMILAGERNITCSASGVSIEATSMPYIPAICSAKRQSASTCWLLAADTANKVAMHIGHRPGHLLPTLCDARRPENRRIGRRLLIPQELSRETVRRGATSWLTCTAVSRAPPRY